MARTRVTVTLSAAEHRALLRWAEDLLQSPAVRAGELLRQALRDSGRLSSAEQVPPGSGPYRSG